ncbi:MAG: FAD-dependent oxidoreductase [Clostridia bacterium]|nr:FAD-dependent oxidoreductase [Clostridia bacterium]
MKRALTWAIALCMLLGTMNLAAAEQTTYTGTAQGFGGLDVSAEVTVENGKVIGLTVDDSTQTYSMAGVTREDSIDKLIAAILENGSTDGLDARTGATITSTAILDAVNQALVNAGAAEAPNMEVAFVPGTYEGVSAGRNGVIKVNVTVNESEITDVTVTEQYETAGIADLPMTRIPQEIVSYQSLGVDTVTGATLASSGILNAVANAVQQAGCNPAALRAVPVEYPVEAVADMDTQVVVVGAGIAGMTAAIRAADLGAEVILVEKLPYTGGTLIVAAGGMSVANSKYVAENSESDNNIEYMMDYVHRNNDAAIRKPDYDFVEYLMMESGKTVDYLAYDLKMPMRVAAGSNGAVDQIYVGGEKWGAGFVDEYNRVLAEKGVTVLRNTAATELVMDGNTVAGVKCTAAGGEFIIRAQKTILATGGASRDMERMTKVTPGLLHTGLDNQTSAGSTGDGFAMLDAIGAKMGDGPYLKSSVPMFNQAMRTTWLNTGSMAGSLFFDAQGIRFINEAYWNSSVAFNSEVADHGSDANYILFDQAMASARPNVSNDGTTFIELLDRYADNPQIAVKGANIREIAEKLSIDADVLEATYTRYQQLCANGVDTDLGKDASRLVAYDESNGLYAVRVTPGAFGSVGGALTDYQFRPIYEDGAMIPNLFTVGELATSTLFGDYYMGGFSLAYYSAAGRIAGEIAVQELTE